MDLVCERMTREASSCSWLVAARRRRNFSATFKACTVPCQCPAPARAAIADGAVCDRPGGRANMGLVGILVA